MAPGEGLLLVGAQPLGHELRELRVLLEHAASPTRLGLSFNVDNIVLVCVAHMMMLAQLTQAG